MTFDTHLNIADWLVRWTLDRKVWVQALTGSLCCVPELNTLIPKCLYLPPPHSPLKSINALCWTLKKPDTPRANDLLGDYPEVLRAVDKHPIQRVEGGGDTFSYLMLQKESLTSHGLLGLKDLTFGIQLWLWTGFRPILILAVHSTLDKSCCAMCWVVSQTRWG